MYAYKNLKYWTHVFLFCIHRDGRQNQLQNKQTVHLQTIENLQMSMVVSYAFKFITKELIISFTVCLPIKIHNFELIVNI